MSELSRQRHSQTQKTLGAFRFDPTVKDQHGFQDQICLKKYQAHLKEKPKEAGEEDGVKVVSVAEDAFDMEAAHREAEERTEGQEVAKLEAVAEDPNAEKKRKIQDFLKKKIRNKQEATAKPMAPELGDNNLLGNIDINACVSPKTNRMPRVQAENQQAVEVAAEAVPDPQRNMDTEADDPQPEASARPQPEEMEEIPEDKHANKSAQKPVKINSLRLKDQETLFRGLNPVKPPPATPLEDKKHASSSIDKGLTSRPGIGIPVGSHHFLEPHSLLRPMPASIPNLYTFLTTPIEPRKTLELLITKEKSSLFGKLYPTYHITFLVS